ncbi:HNH endonuclease [Chromohalobacter moromii]|uniref:HNH endonuclease n=2 Tax=Chromohalobacter TaxID=42054 RepID=UPI001FFC38FB|nr:MULTISPECIES: HNH endonuclease [Chromohalobacter]
MCPRKTISANGYCEDHQHLVVAWQKSRQKSSGRGGRPWRRIRDRILQRDRYLCQLCERKGVITPANEVDHIVNRESGGSDAEWNLEAICTPCHKAKTARESQAGRL